MSWCFDRKVIITSTLLLKLNGLPPLRQTQDHLSDRADILFPLRRLTYVQNNARDNLAARACLIVYCSTSLLTLPFPPWRSSRSVQDELSKNFRPVSNGAVVPEKSSQLIIPLSPRVFIWLLSFLKTNICYCYSSLCYILAVSSIPYI